MQVLGGLAFSEFRGYEDWQTVSVSQTEGALAVILANSVMPGTLADKPPQGNDAKCGFACHTIVKAKDYVFTAYPKR